ncbi:MAG: hypothetical protein R3Y19_06290, partial [Rikenellaceae bacterium]
GTRVEGQPHFLQGEKVIDNYPVIYYKDGGAFMQTVEIPYTESLRLAELVFVVEAKLSKQGKATEFTEYDKEIPVALATNSIQLLADNYAKVALITNSFQRTTEISQNANLMYSINSSTVTTAALNSSEIAALEQFIIENDGDPRRTVSDVYTQSYASPDGPLGLNEELSVKRGASTQKAINERFRQNDVPFETFDVDPMGEDWEGFKELVQASNIQDRDIILQVLSMYSDPQVRDREIKNMTVTFKVLAEKILPELRRSKMSVNVVIEGMTDQELMAAASSDLNSLNAEEMLFAATLFDDNATKAKIYQAAANQYNDYRAWNNLGVVSAWEGDYATADKMFNKASALNNSSPEIVNNLGVVALASGKKDDAAKFFAASSAPEAKYNKGLVELSNGNYNLAAQSLEGYNKALAEYLNGNVSSAKSILSGCDSWEAYYLQAVIAANEGNGSDLISNLSSAMSLNAEVVEPLAATEVNFVEFFTNSDFAELIDVTAKFSYR